MELLVGLNVIFACLAYYYCSARNKLQEEVNQKANRIINEAEVLACERIEEANKRERIAKEFLETKGREYPILAKVIADFKNAQDFAEANHILKTRKLVSGTREKIQCLTGKNRDLLAEIEALKWKLQHIISVCPNIEEIFDDSNMENFADNYSANVIRKANGLYAEKLREAEGVKQEILSSAQETAQALRKEADDCYRAACELGDRTYNVRVAEAEKEVKDAEAQIVIMRKEADDYCRATRESGERYLEKKMAEGDRIYNVRIAEAEKEVEETKMQSVILREGAERFVEDKKKEGEKIYAQRVTDGNKYYNECTHRAEVECKEKKQLVEEWLSKKIIEFPTISTMMADYVLAKDAAIEAELINKRPPALKAAEEVKRIKAEKKNLITENLAYKWELEYIKNLVPWVDEIEETSISPESNYINPDYQSDDGAGLWLSTEEYNTLPVVEKCQLALDRYQNRHKSNAEIGREYERYIGYLYEQQGFSVEYFGIQQGLEDMGRDLVCKKGDAIHVVQCKCWSNKKQKVIHEKHINQLYGTAIMYGIETRSMDKEKENFLFESSKKVIPVFVSTVPYSDKAMEFATYLGIECRIEPLKEYPMIKCNISDSTGEKIYHLPFDQQYDKCIIEPNKGECYAMTVKEAEEKGFRRAKRWRGNNG